MTPIEKNVIVVDAKGNEYEATYPKRAKGLVKNGRARFVDENTICLIETCPPDTEKTEDIKMSENIEKTEATAEVTSNEPATIERILENLTILQSKMTDLTVSPSVTANSIAGTIEHMAEGSLEGNVGDIVSDIAGMFAMREENYRNLIALYDKMLTILTEEKKRTQNNIDRIGAIVHFTKTLRCEDFDGQVWDMLMETLKVELLAETP